jgi:hypothetical protein
VNSKLTHYWRLEFVSDAGPVFTHPNNTRGTALNVLLPTPKSDIVVRFCASGFGA